MSQDENPFGPRGAWGRQPPTTFGVSAPVRRERPAPQRPRLIRAPAPRPDATASAARGILSGGLAPTPAPRLTDPPPRPEPPIAAESADRTLVSDSVLARTNQGPGGLVGCLPLMAGTGLLIAAVAVAAALVLAPRTPGTEAPTPAAPPVAAVALTSRTPPPAQAAVAKVSPAPRTAAPRPSSAPARRPEAPRVEAIAPAPLDVPPPVALTPAAPAIPAPAPPTDPDAPMATRIPGVG